MTASHTPSLPLEQAGDHGNRDPLESPVFILGLHRSGTTLLYEMLTEVGHWNTLWAWHVAAYDDIRSGMLDPEQSQASFRQRLVDAGMETRGVDAVKAGPQSKEEYCFIMDNHGYGNKLTARGFPLFQEICAAVQQTQSASRPLLLKNPWDVGNAPVIKQLIPSARFVYIHRHPRDTVESMWRFLHQALQVPNVYMAMMSRRYAEITKSRWKMGLLGTVVRRAPGLFIDALISWFGRQSDQFLRSVDAIPAADHAEITYDQLCTHPNETIRKILTQFDIPDNGYDFSSMISRRNRPCSPLVAAKSAKIERRMAGYLACLRALESN
ncbi:MAG: sulfotransferase [Fuerstiella sp.]